MQITAMGHAGFVLQTARSTVLIDPVLRDTPLGPGAFTFSPSRVVDYSALPAPTIVVVSHAHWDHFDRTSMAQLARNGPVVVPRDATVQAGLKSLGFSDVRPIGPWETIELGDVRITATPSSAAVDINEMGVLVSSEGTTFWDMVDSEVSPHEAERVRLEFGRIDVVAVKYQPQGKLEMQVLHGLGSTLNKREIVSSIEAAVACQPKFAFPSACGLAFLPPYAGMNRLVFPFAPSEVVEMLSRRLGSSGAAAVVLPGDVIDISTQGVRHHSQGCSFVKVGSDHIDTTWEPVEGSALAGVEMSQERDQLERSLERFLIRDFSRWLAEEVTGRAASWPAASRFREFAIVWQLVVWCGDGCRLEYWIDFGAPKLALRRGISRRANFAVHVSGGAMLSILRDGCDPGDVLYLCGGVRIFEKVIGVSQDGLVAPSASGWDFFEQFAEPLSAYFRSQRRGQAERGAQ